MRLNKKNVFFAEKHKMNCSENELNLLTINIGFANHQADWNWKNVRSPFARIYLVTEGEAKVIIEDRCIRLTPGHLYFIPAYTTHSYVCTGLFCHYYLHLYEDNISGTSMMDEWSLPTEIESVRMDGELLKRLCDINPLLKLPESNPDSYDNNKTLINNIQLSKQQPLCYKIESRGITAMLFSRFMKFAKSKNDVNDARIQRAISYIHNHMNERIELSTLIDKACMSKDHFIRIFKSEMGITPNAYIIQRKIEKAELLLVTTQLPIKIIAKSLGYEDSPYFNHTFKKTTGATPNQYRKNHF